MQRKKSNLTKIALSKLFEHGLSPIIFTITLLALLFIINYVFAVKTSYIDITKDKIFLSYNSEEDYTTTEQYNVFSKENGLPALFVEANACESDIIQKECNALSPEINYCWPQVNIGNGVWAYYSMSSKACNAFSSTEPFLGEVLRNYKTQTVVIGDITAHMI